MYPVKLDIKEVQYDISAKCNEIALYTSDNQKILNIHDYDNFVDINLLKQLIKKANESESIIKSKYLNIWDFNPYE